MIIWKIQYFGVQAQSWARHPYHQKLAKSYIRSSQKLSHEIVQKKARIRRQWFISMRMYEKSESEVVARNRAKKGSNLPPMIYFHAHVVWEIENRFSMAVFTNFAASLARQPSTVLLAPRLNKFFQNFVMKIPNCKTVTKKIKIFFIFFER